MTVHDTNSYWVTQLNNGDDAAFEAIYHQYHQAVYANICRLVNRPEEAEDLLQEVFVALWQSRYKLTIQQSIGGWLFTTSYYKSLAHIRRSVKENLTLLSETLNEIPDEETTTEEDFSQRIAIVNTAIELLPPRKRVAFCLCRLEGKTYEEAAAVLEISTESVRDYVKTASIFIKKYIMENNSTMPAISVLLISVYLQV